MHNLHPEHAHLLPRDDPPAGRPARPSESNDPTKHHRTASILGPIVGVVVLILIALGAFYAYRYYRSRKLGLPPPSLNPFASQSDVSTRNYPARGGIVGWAQSKYRSLRNKRTAGGAYEGTSGTGGRAGRARGGGGFGALDPDEAWDARVGSEADGYNGGRGGAGGYYEEQELGFTQGRPGRDSLGAVEPYESGGYGRLHEDTGYAPARGLAEIIPGEEEHGGRAKRELDARYREETGGRGGVGQNPFDEPRGSARTLDPFGDHADVDMRGVSPRPIDTGTKQHGKQGSKDETSPTERRSVFRESV